VLGTIAGELGMSVVPVREAIRQLEAEGLVMFERNVGARVSMVDDTAYRFSMQSLSILEGGDGPLRTRAQRRRRAPCTPGQRADGRDVERFDPAPSPR
jgi:DNA-binding GntR family transcriptional regulator